MLTGLALGVELTAGVPPGRLSGVVGPVAFVAGFAGFLGLVPAVVDWHRPVGVVGAVLVAIGLVGMVAIELANLVELVGAAPPAWVDALNLARYLGMVGFLVVGGASVWRRPRDRPLGRLLVAAAVIEFVALAVIIAGAPEWTILLAIGANTAVYGAIAYLLRGHAREAEVTAAAPT